MARPLFDRVVQAEMNDVSTASSTFVVSPYKGRIIRIQGVLHAAITSANAALTTEINGTAVTGGGFTIVQSGSAAGDTFEAYPTGANFVEEGDVIEFITDGASSTTARMTCVATIRESGAR